MFSTNQSICLRFRSQPIRLRKIALAKRKPANLYTNIGSSIMAEGVRLVKKLLAFELEPTLEKNKDEVIYGFFNQGP